MHRLVARLCSFVVGVLALDVACAQSPSAVRSWGTYASTTEARDGRFVAIAAGEDATVVIRDDGRAFANGVNSAATCEVPIVPGRKFTEIAVRELAYGLLDDGSIVGWTGGLFWQFYPGGLAPPAPPLPPGVRYTQVGVGIAHGAALRSDGSLVAWGQNPDGQLNVPPLPPGTGYVRIRAGLVHTLALLTDGTIQAWGGNTYGQCNVPPLPPGATYVGMDAGQLHSVALRSDGVLVAWGQNASGQCNVTQAPPGTRYVLACAGAGHTVACRSDGQFVQWGYAIPPWIPATPAPVVPAHRRCVQLVAGSVHTVALLDDGTVLAWGDNSAQQSFLPAPGSTPKARRYVASSCGVAHSVAVRANGELIGWGNDYYGQATAPLAFAGMRFARVGAGAGHSVALRRDGTLLAWGNTAYGMCNVPPLPVGTTYVDFATCDSHTVALRSDGAAVAFGNTTFGSGTIPALPPGTRYELADCIYSKTMLVRSDGVIVYAGDTSYGQGIVPTAPPGLRFVDAAAARAFNAGLLSDGTVVLWGGYALGPPPDWRPVPPLPFGVYYVDIDGAYFVTILRRSDGLVEVAGNVTSREDRVPPLDPGTSYVEVSAGAQSTLSARVGPTSTYVSFTPGCAGSLQPARLIPRDTPAIGKTLAVNVFDLPQGLAILLFGLQRLTPPLPLAALGMPGCDLHVTPDAVFPLGGASNQAMWTLSIPDDQALVGLHFYNQALVFDAAAGNTLGAVMSNAAEGVIGDL